MDELKEIREQLALIKNEDLSKMARIALMAVFFDKDVP